GTKEWTDESEANTTLDLWLLSSSGEYFEKNICSIVRNITGSELPASFYEELTFEADQPASDQDCDLVLSMCLSEVLAGGVEMKEIGDY
ncbi:hypothetical protein ACO22_07420, partial [Paracoccidioides brasiliensis]